jgi:hypothetical protein
MPAVMEFPSQTTLAPAQRATKTVRVVVHTPETEADDPAHNFAMMGLAWLITMAVVLSSFVLLQFLFRQ